MFEVGNKVKIPSAITPPLKEPIINADIGGLAKKGPKLVEQTQSDCPPECPPGFALRTIGNGNPPTYSCDKFSLGGSDGNIK